MSCSDKDCRKILEDIFDSLDKDHSGQLDSKELTEVLSLYYKEKKANKDPAQIAKECKEIITALDKNKDGGVSKKEFVDFVMSK